MGPFALHFFVVLGICGLRLVLEGVEVVLEFLGGSGGALEPRVRLDLSHGVAFGWIRGSQTDDQIEELGTGVNLAHIHGFNGILMHSAVVDIVGLTEGEFTIAHNEEHDTDGETVNWGAFVRFITSGEELGGHVVWSAEFSRKNFSLRTIENLLHAKISNFQRDIIIEEAVLKLQVSVRNLLLVDILNGRDQLCHDLSSIGGVEAFGSFDKVKDFTVCCNFRHNVENIVADLITLDDLTAASTKQLKHVRVVKSSLTGLNFRSEGLIRRFVHFLENFNTAFQVILRVFGHITHTKGTISKLLEKVVVLERLEFCFNHRTSYCNCYLL